MICHGHLRTHVVPTWRLSAFIKDASPLYVNQRDKIAATVVFVITEKIDCAILIDHDQ